MILLAAYALAAATPVYAADSAGAGPVVVAEAPADEETPAPIADEAPPGDEAPIESEPVWVEPKPLPAEEAAAVAADLFGYIESIETMRGRFIQIGPDGSVQDGMFYLRRPGRARFEYDAPNPTLIVADGTWVIVQDRDLETTDRVPLRSTPLKFLLQRNVKTDDLRVERVVRAPGEVAVTLAADDEDTAGALTMVFSQPTLELRQWTVVDGRGYPTTVALSDVVSGVSLDPRLFVVRDETRFTRGR